MTDLHLLDANALIDAHQDYYPLDRIPGFWSWLVGMGQAGVIKVPGRIYDEVAPNKGPLPAWLRQADVKRALVLNEAADMDLVQMVLDKCYAPDLDDVELQTIGQDPFLIAAALAGNGRFVVSKETSKVTALRAKRKIPDACNILGLPHMTDFALYRKLAFSLP